jgi:hypothetical protein
MALAPSSFVHPTAVASDGGQNFTRAAAELVSGASTGTCRLRRIATSCERVVGSTARAPDSRDRLHHARPGQPPTRRSTRRRPGSGACSASRGLHEREERILVRDERRHHLHQSALDGDVRAHRYRVAQQAVERRARLVDVGGTRFSSASGQASVFVTPPEIPAEGAANLPRPWGIRGLSSRCQGGRGLVRWNRLR